jgi:hypothetical protein
MSASGIITAVTRVVLLGHAGQLPEAGDQTAGGGVHGSGVCVCVGGGYCTRDVEGRWACNRDTSPGYPTLCASHRCRSFTC